MSLYKNVLQNTKTGFKRIQSAKWIKPSNTTVKGPIDYVSFRTNNLSTCFRKSLVENFKFKKYNVYSNLDWIQQKLKNQSVLVVDDSDNQSAEAILHFHRTGKLRFKEYSHVIFNIKQFNHSSLALFYQLIVRQKFHSRG